MDEIREFQQVKKRCFSNKTGHSKAQEASYRKVSVYTKSMKRYNKERERRRQVRLLAEAGHTQKQIANELGVSTRTIKRDWDKIRPYVKSQTRKEIKQVVDARRAELERRYEGLNSNEKLKLLKQDVKAATKEMRALQTSNKQQEQHKQTLHQLEYTIDLDTPTWDDFPSIILPQLDNTPHIGGVGIKFYAIKNGEKRELFNINISTKNITTFH
jgi:DNA-binding CsgD family transcriptional regulator